jgi:thiol:disulfide interchange protein
MPPVDPTPAGSSRPLPRLLLIVAAALLVARVGTGVWEDRHPQDKVELVAWSDPALAEGEAARSQKPILYEFSADWCEPCKVMSREIFSDEQHAKMIRATFVTVRVIDRQREDGRNSPAVESLEQRFGVKGFPTLVVARPGDPHYESLTGYRGTPETMSWLSRNAMVVHMRLMNAPPDSVLPSR